ncbi:inactive phospholipase D5 isoform X3 [Silurus meridionalis]|uniref:inactive phospholipase D5 isoform X3 n=1 Tax=Silurus meridionalis TaxID=175797 RepID=UPI001EEA7E95|nr:inactive phospholipase D5 isoform X3 [Silurus meridionalis]
MKSQQKCIVIFALVCCFAVLVALIFSAVDVLGEDDDILNDDNCSDICQVVLVENIPEDISISHEGTTSLTAGLHSLLDLAQKSVEIVSPWWDLNSTEQDSRFPQAKQQGRLLLHRLLGLKAQHVQLKIASSTASPELDLLSHYGADVRYLNMTALTKGLLHSSFWVVDRKHVYIGSAAMDWRSLSTLKELGIVVYECRCLAVDLHRIFNLYWQLEYKEFVPTIWSKRLSALYSKEEHFSFHLNGSLARAYFSSSPNIFRPKDRTTDTEAIFRVIQDAKRFICISMTDYLPLLSSTSHTKYWSRIDGMLREALVLKNLQIRLLISCREQTHPLTFNFLWSLQNLCIQISNCSMEARFFSPRVRDDGSPQDVHHHRYVVTDNSVYIGNLDWVGNEFVYNAGAGLVVSEPGRSSTLSGRLRAVFDRDWRSPYAKPLQPNKIPTCSWSTAGVKGHTGHTEDTAGPNASL